MEKELWGVFGPMGTPPWQQMNESRSLSFHQLQVEAEVQGKSARVSGKLLRKDTTLGSTKGDWEREG